MQKPVLVVKLGTTVITNKDGIIDNKIITKVIAEIAELIKDYQVVLVSSGAVSSGRSFIKNYKGTLVERKVAAAIGNPILIQLYHKHFSQYGITVAQALCERHHFSNRGQFLQLKETFLEFWKNDILPVVNENDLVSNIELKFSDNDELATLIAIGLNADTMIICTSAGGLLDSDKQLISNVDKIDDKVFGYVTNEKSILGLGGMLSKLTFTRLATSLGIRVIICGVSLRDSFPEALSGNTGTTFKPQKSNLKARHKWLASGSITFGGIQVDNGAEKALVQRKSLLTIGVTKVQGTFSAGEVVQLINEEENIIGVAKVKLSAAEVAANVSKRNIIAAHVDNIVIF